MVRKAVPSWHATGWWEPAQPQVGTEAGRHFPMTAPGRGTSLGLAPRGTMGSPRRSRLVALWCPWNDFSLRPCGEAF